MGTCPYQIARSGYTGLRKRDGAFDHMHIRGKSGPHRGNGQGKVPRSVQSLAGAKNIKETYACVLERGMGWVVRKQGSCSVGPCRQYNAK